MNAAAKIPSMTMIATIVKTIGFAAKIANAALTTPTANAIGPSNASNPPTTVIAIFTYLFVLAKPMANNERISAIFPIAGAIIAPNSIPSPSVADFKRIIAPSDVLSMISAIPAAVTLVSFSLVFISSIAS